MWLIEKKGIIIQLGIRCPPHRWDVYFDIKLIWQYLINLGLIESSISSIHYHVKLKQILWLEYRSNTDSRPTHTCVTMKHVHRVGLNYVLSLVIFRKTNNTNIAHFNPDTYNLHKERKDIFSRNQEFFI